MLAAVTQRQSSNMADWHMVLSAWPGPFRQLALRRNNSYARDVSRRYAGTHNLSAANTTAPALARQNRKA
jgi:hypothetical protein